MKKTLTLIIMLLAAAVYGPVVNPAIAQASPSGSVQQSLEEAIKAARSNHEDIVLKEGTYFISRPLVFGPEDSGLTIRGAGAGKTLISGGVELPAFTDRGDGVWTLDLSDAYPLGAAIEQLYVNGRRAVLARVPNLAEKREDGSFIPTHVDTQDTEKGLVSTIDCFLTGKVTETVIDSTSATMKVVGYVMNRLYLQPEVSRLLEGIGTNPKQLRVSFFHSWNESSRHVSSIAGDRSSLTFAGRYLPSWNKLDKYSQFILEDDIHFLDAPGEWFYDKSENILYYIPRPGENISTTRATVPAPEKLIIVTGTESDRVKNLTFKDLTLEYSSAPFGTIGLNPSQASAFSDAAICVDYADSVRFESCEITHTGNTAIWMKTACRGCSVTDCNIHDIGACAVKIGTFYTPDDEESLLTRGITVRNCYLMEGGRVDAAGTGVTILNASDCNITHNEVADFFYTGISAGWSWGYTSKPVRSNDISYNLIHHIGQGRLSDMGGIYTLPPCDGTTITHNVIHDVSSLSYGGWGIYPDEGSTGVLIENNLVYNCNRSAFHENYGKDIVVRNNIFANSQMDQLAITRVEDHCSLDFESNIVFYTTGKLYDLRWDIANTNVKNNLYWCTSGPVDFGGRTLKEWQSATGKDAGSIIADPHFKTGTFTPTNRKALRKIQFIPFDPSEAGVER